MTLRRDRALLSTVLGIAAATAQRQESPLSQGRQKVLFGDFPGQLRLLVPIGTRPDDPRGRWDPYMRIV